jgi:glycosyltransferase involved in cell wall biosynthesis
MNWIFWRPGVMSGDLDEGSFRDSFRLGTYTATQFKPSVAKALYEKHDAVNVLDTSCGWGDRLAGFYATPSTKLYVGCDPNPDVFEVYKKQYPDVHFTGFKTGKDLARYYANAEVFVFPSQWETFGIVMIEAMACGTPVAAFPCDGPLDVIDQAETGFMNENLSDAIDGCLQLDRDRVLKGSQRWSWENAWKIFKNNLT